MCEIPQKYLYKYRSITEFDRLNQSEQGYTRRLLTDGELYFSRFSELRDPNELLFSYADDGDIAVSEEELSRYPHIQIIERLPDGRFHLRVDGHTVGKR